MREKSEILGDAVKALEKQTVLNQSDLKLTLLSIEVLVDICHQLSALTTIMGSVEKIIYRSP